MADAWLPSLQTETPEEGYALAIKLSRMADRRDRPRLKDMRFGIWELQASGEGRRFAPAPDHRAAFGQRDAGEVGGVAAARSQ